MKKSILTLTFLALFSVAANAQDTKKTKSTKSTKTEQAPKAETVNPDGTITPAATDKTEETKKETAPKKSGTRMAINEKGTSGTVKPKATRTEDKKNESPATQPGASKKD